MPALQPMKPGSAGPAMPGIHPVIYDENGDEVPAGSGKAGNICIRNPWPGPSRPSGAIGNVLSQPILPSIAKTLTVRTGATGHISPVMAPLAQDGYYRILGRVDDVINVAGHRLGTKELESASLPSRKSPKRPWSPLPMICAGGSLTCTCPSSLVSPLTRPLNKR